LLFINVSAFNLANLIFFPHSQAPLGNAYLQIKNNATKQELGSESKAALWLQQEVGVVL